MMINSKLTLNEYPILKYKKERLSIKLKIMKLLKSKKLPKYPISDESSECIECAELNKKLANRHYYELERIDKQLFMGDLMFLSDEAFRYYIFEAIIYFYESDLFYDILIEQLFFNKYSEKRLSKFDEQEVEIILSFFTNISNEINDVIGNRNKYQALSDWEQEEVYHPLKSLEKEIHTAIEQWRKKGVLSDVLSEVTETKPH